MKNKLILAAILVVLFAVFLAVRFFIVDRQNIYGKIKISSSPAASIFVDNLAIGRTPYEDKLKTGEHLLKLIPEGDATETASWQGKVKVYRNTLTYANMELGNSDVNTAGEIFTATKMDKPPKNGNYGEIYVETEPQGAIVYLDNDEKGIAPVILADVLKGDHELSVYMPGFLRRNQKINVTPGYRVVASFKLAIDPTQKNENSPATGNITATPAPSGKKSVTVKDTPQGWLRVRMDASTDASEEAKIKPGGKYEFLDEKDGWYKIKFNGDKDGLVSGEFTEGWISAQYSEKQ